MDGLVASGGPPTPVLPQFPRHSTYTHKPFCPWPGSTNRHIPFLTSSILTRSTSSSQHLLRTGTALRGFTYIERQVLLSPLYRQTNGGTERLSNLTKVTQLELGSSRTQSQVRLILTQDATPPLFSTVPFGAWGSLLGLPRKKAH